MDRSGLLLMVALFFPVMPKEEGRSPDPKPDDRVDQPSAWVESTGQDDGDRILRIRTNKFGGTFAFDQPIPVAVEILTRDQTSAQLFPHLDIWLEHDGKQTHQMVKLDIKNRIHIGQKKKFEHVFDLRKELKLSGPGVYRVAVGHANYFVSDIGDWTGSLKSAEYVIRIVKPDGEAR